MAGLVPAIHAGTVCKSERKNHSVATLSAARALGFDVTELRSEGWMKWR
ncbi:hypothetical protein [Methylocystis sp. S23]|jgi:hypothetical protein